MSGVLGSRVEVPCPVCGHPIRVTLGDIQSGRTVFCPSGHQVKLSEEGNGIRRVDQAMKDLERTIQQVKRRLR